MKIFEVTEAKVEMCPEACCGKPVTECKCGPDCKHCDCYNKNKEDVSETPLAAWPAVAYAASRIPPTTYAGAATAIGTTIAKAIKHFEELIKRNPKHPKVSKVKAELAKLKPMLEKAQAGLDETATVGGTSAGDVSVITSVPGAKRKVGKGKNGLPKAPQATNADGTAKNALDMTANVMGGKAIKR
jgi:hypothetical protein